MNRCLHLLLAAVLVLPLGFANLASAQDRQTLSSQAGRGPQSGVFFRQVRPYRVDDAGRPRALWRQQVVYRAVNDTFIYRSEGKATTRDEVSSPVMIFHVKEGTVRSGHVYQNRGN